MKKLTLLVTLAVAALMFTSCEQDNYKNFVGTWGCEKIEYYNLDYAGNPIPASMETYTYDPEDFNNSIHLIFKSNKTGEMRDSAIDSLPVIDPETQTFDHYVQCPDTVLVTKFTYNYVKEDQVLYLTLSNMRNYRLVIQDKTDNSFIYENEYLENYMEKAYMKRVSTQPKTSKSRSNAVKHPFKMGSLLSGSNAE